MESTCTGPECDRPVRCVDLCAAHYKQKRRGKPLVPVGRERKPCRIDGCEATSHARQLCPKHYARFRAHGDPMASLEETAEEFAQRMVLGVKECADCGEVKNFSEFYKSVANRDGRAYLCKPCSAIRQSAWHAANAESNRQRSHRRRSWERAGSGIDVDLLWAESDGYCPDCGTKINRAAKWRQPGFGSVDHIFPLSRGGTHTQDNVRLTCLPCNISKGAKIITNEQKGPARNG